MKNIFVIGLLAISALATAQMPESPQVTPASASPMRVFYKSKITPASANDKITPAKWDAFFGIIDSQKADISSLAAKADTVAGAENVFYVLRIDSLSGKFGTARYNAQLSRARAGNTMLAYPSVYAARDAAYQFVQKKARRAVIKVLTGHYEVICTDTKPVLDADRFFTGDVGGIYEMSASPAIAPLKQVWDMDIPDSDIETMDFRLVAPQKNPNSSSLFVDGVDLICEAGSTFHFSGLNVWYGWNSNAAILAFDSLRLTDATLSFMRNVRTDYSVERLGIAGGYCHDFQSQYAQVRIGRMTYLKSPWDAWGWTGFGYLRTCIAIQNAQSVRGNFRLSVGETFTANNIASYGLNAPRIVATDVHVNWNASNSHLYFPIIAGNFNAIRKGFAVKNTMIRVSGVISASRPNFPNNLHYQNIRFLELFPQTFSSSNKFVVDGDFSAENSVSLGSCDVDFRGSLLLNEHLYNGATVTPSFSVNGAVRFGGRLETKSISLGGVIKPLPSGSVSIPNTYGLPVW